MVNENLTVFFFNLVISGASAGVAKTIVAPADRMKIILQSQNSAYQILTGEVSKYQGIMDIIKRLPKEQGYLSFWRGNGINIVRYIFSQGMNFSFNDIFKEYYFSFFRENTRKNVMLGNFICGGMAGITSTLLVFPLEFCQTRISADMGADSYLRCKTKREFTGLKDCMKTVYRSDGLRGWYRGLVMELIGIAIYRSCYFGMFDAVKRIFAEDGLGHKEPVQLSFFSTICIAQAVTTFSGFCSYPLDTVGRRLMLDAGRPKHLRLFNNSWHVTRTLYASEGIKGFYRGLTMNFVRNFGGALVLVFYDGVLYYTDWKNKLLQK